MRFYKLFAAALCCTSLALFSCGGDDPKTEEPSTGPVVPGTPDEPTEQIKVYTPTESKEFLSNTATDFMKIFRAADHAETVHFCQNFGEEYGDLDFPDSFDVLDDDNPSFAPSVFFRNLLHGLKSANPARVNAAPMVYTYNINFSRFTGVYIPGRDAWIKKSDSKDIVFEFDLDGYACVLRAEASGGTTDKDIEVSDYDWDYNPSTGDWEEYEYTDLYKLSIPHTVKVSLTKGNSQMLTATINSKIDFKNHNLSWDVYTKVANIEAASKGNGVDSQVTETSSFIVGGKTLITTNSQVNGNHLCNYDKINNSINGEDDDDYAILTYLTDATSVMNVMDKVQIRANGKLNRQVIDAMDGYWDYYDYSRSEAEAECKKACENLNKYITAKVYYNNAGTVQAEVRFQPEFDDWGYSGWDAWEYYIMPVLYFPADQTTYTFEDYGAKGFGRVEDLWESQLDNYERLWK